MFKFNSQGIPDSRQSSIDGVKEVVTSSGFFAIPIVTSSL